MTKRKSEAAERADQARVDEANAAHEREEQSRLDSLRSSKDLFKDKMMSWTKGASPLSFWLTPSAFANFMLGNRDTFFFPHQEKHRDDAQVLRDVAKVGDLIRISTNPIDPVRQEETRSTDMTLVARITRVEDGILGDPPSAEVAETFKSIHGIDLTSEAVWSCEVEVADHSVVNLLDNKSPLVLALLNVTGNLRDLMAAAVYLETLLDSLEPDPKSFVDAPMLRSFVKLLQSCQTPCPQALLLKAAKDCLL